MSSSLIATIKISLGKLERSSTGSTHSARITPTPTRPHRGGGSTNRSADTGPPP
jgi:hypothetical protein